MEEKRKKPAFESRLTPLQRTLGWIYLPLHALVLPLLLLLYDSVRAPQTNAVTVNLIYYALGIVFVLAVMLRYLRAEYDVLLDRLPGCILTALLGMAILYALNTVAAILTVMLDSVLSNPNDEAVLELASMDIGVMRALSVFIAPIVEEVLFRGVLFGSLRRRSRGWAYVLSAVAFGLYHVWQAAVLSGRPEMLLYAVQYVPIAVVLAWCYERSGSLWTGIFYHMAYNALSFSLLEMIL